MSKLFIIGTGPGATDLMSVRAHKAMEESDIIIGYKTYIDLVRSAFPDKEFKESGMREEISRCREAVELAQSGKTVSLICSGDAGVYGMASPALLVADDMGFADTEVIPGITAATAGAAVLGAPLGHDFCVISLSDLLTPWELIEKRLRCAAEGDFCISIYNPASKGRKDHLRNAAGILLEILPGERICGYVKNIGREGEVQGICTLKELAELDADMFTTVFVGNSRTKNVAGHMVTPRGYRDE
ncbi:MAG: precorrin-3B C(17)-methyltransferase [Lachnospiraceae bacterium]|nr:precorrin-3B C(17)-methyltransferase [Lachnospiraceae bacterium]